MDTVQSKFTLGPIKKRNDSLPGFSFILSEIILHRTRLLPNSPNTGNDILDFIWVTCRVFMHELAEEVVSLVVDNARVNARPLAGQFF